MKVNNPKTQNGFKQTDIGLIPEDWEEIEFEDTLLNNYFFLLDYSKLKNDNR